MIALNTQETTAFVHDTQGLINSNHSQEEDSSAWVQVHQRLVELSRQQAELDYDHGQLLLAALREKVYERLGFASLIEYSAHLLKQSPRQTAERLRVAEALKHLPELTKASRTGQLCWSVVRELTRVAVPETEREWMETTRGKTVRDVEQLVSGKSKGQRPTDPVDPQVKTYKLSFEISAQTLTAFKDGVAKLRRDTGEKLSEEEALLMMARQVLVGPGQEGLAGYQVAMTVCERCGQGSQESGGELVPVSEEIVEMALCDPQHIGCVDGSCGQHTGVGSEDTHVGKSNSSSESDNNLVPPLAGRSSETCVSCGDNFDGKAKSAPQSPTIPTRPPRATQSIPPAIGRMVRRRQKGTCAVHGCRCSVYIDLHHVRYRHDGKCGPDDIIGLCYAHHKRVHAGLLIIDGTYSTGLSFYHADGSEYGERSVSAVAMAAREQALNALVGLGFRKKEVEGVLVKVCARVGRQSSVEQVIRQALGELTRR